MRVDGAQAEGMKTVAMLIMMIIMLIIAYLVVVSRVLEDAWR